LHETSWSTSAHSKGIYFYRLEAGEVRIAKAALHLE
jgi:hypothetical protein